MDLGPFFYIWIHNLLQSLFSTFSTSNHHFPHYTFNPLFSASRWDWQPHFVLCAGALSSPTGSITLVSFLRENLLLHSSYLPLGVSQWTCDLYVSSTFSGAVAGDKRRSCLANFNSCQQLFFWHRCLLQSSSNHFFRRHFHQAAARGVSHFQHFYFVIFLLSLLLLCVVCYFIKNPKKN